MFGCIVAGRPVQTNLVTVSPTQFIFSLPDPPSINHLVVFLLPTTELPLTHGATVHIRLPSSGSFRLLGAISANKPSAIFRVRDLGVGNGEEVVVGMSIEEAAVVEAQLAQLPTETAKKGRTVVLARRIIENAFNYLGSWAQGPEDLVPMKAFRQWWEKFEKKVEMDPGFLEREGEAA